MLKASLLSLRSAYGLVVLGIVGAIVGVAAGQIVSAQTPEVKLHEYEFGMD